MTKAASALAICCVALLAPLIGCSEPLTPADPPRTGGRVPEPPAPPQPTQRPPAPANAAVYVERLPIYQWYSNNGLGDVTTIYLFYEGGRFALQWTSAVYGVYSYVGSCARTTTGISLTFDADSPRPWLADVDVVGDVLTVRYNEEMSFDFFGGDYVLAPPGNETRSATELCGA